MPRIIFSLLFAAVGCSELTVIGVSGEQQPPATPPEPHTVTEIAGLPGQLLQSNTPGLGDIDGDGYDDFLLASSKLNGDVPDAFMTAYLFYGRPSFGDKLSASDADATFEMEANTGFSLGDVNSDGLADFVLASRDGFELIFGTGKRWSGHHAKFSAGVVMTYPHEEDSLTERSGINSVRTVGDVNGDGKADFALSVIHPDSEIGNNFGVGMTDYIMLGRADGWPTGQWEPSWADAELGAYGVKPLRGRLLQFASGDLDGDGLSDILVMGGGDGTLLYYGKQGGFRGLITPGQADAELAFPYLESPLVIGDLDGDHVDELAIVPGDQIGIVYGSKTRYSGHTEPKIDLTFADKGPYSSVIVADTNGDGRNDLLFWGNSEEGHFDMRMLEPPLQPRLYEVRGTGKRLTGEVRGPSTLFQPAGYPAPAALDDGGLFFDPAGDLDGDGSSDLLVGVPGQNDLNQTVVYLLPGSMNVPQ